MAGINWVRQSACHSVIRPRPRCRGTPRARFGVWAPTRKAERIKKNDNQTSVFTGLENGGFIYQAHSGVFHMLPLGVKVIDKISRVVDLEMARIGAQKVSLSSITAESLWRKTGRLDAARDQLFGITDRRNSRFLLAPTHEEEITAMVSRTVGSSKDLPLRLYQIGRKYRDEPRPRQGLLRAREFIMKDLYTFDQTAELAAETYDCVRQAYDRIFRSLGLAVVVADADSGMMGGNTSHEYHVLSEAGEDTVLVCRHCRFSSNSELAETLPKQELTGEHVCPSCSARSSSHNADVRLVGHRAVELAHTFNLGTRYSALLNAGISADGTGKKTALVMGCHGIGISRILGALAARQTTIATGGSPQPGLVWRPGIAPYDVAVLARSDSVDSKTAAEQVAGQLRQITIPSTLRVDDHLDGQATIPIDVLVEGRESSRSLIWRLNDADLVGYPIVVVVPGQSERAGDDVVRAEIQCRQLGCQKHIPLEQVGDAVRSMLNELLSR